MNKSSEVVIIGGGAAGCATAYYLTKAGIKPVIVEREGIGSQASGFSAGGLNPLQGAGIPGLLAPLAEESFKMHGDLKDSLTEESGVDFHPTVITMVNVAFEDSDIPAMEETLRIFEAAQGFSAHWLKAGELRELEPRISPEAVRGLYTYGNTALNSYQYTVALSKAAEKAGATVRTGVVTGVKKSGGKVTGVILEDGEIPCDAVVVATGPWSAEAGEWLGVSIPVEPLAGEIVRVETPGGTLKQDFSGGGASLYQRADGLVWIGATEERRGFDKDPSEAARDKLLDGARKLMPCMAEATVVKHTACLRPVTADWLPIIGKVPGWDNVYLATGAGKKGILISPGIGKATADLIAIGSTSLPISPFAADRFSQND